VDLLVYSAHATAAAPGQPKRRLPTGLKLAAGIGAALGLALATSARLHPPAAAMLPTKPTATAAAGEPFRAAAPPSTPPASSDLLGLGPGLYQVGTEIQPSEYVLVGESAYFKVMSKNTSEVRSILFNDAFRHRTILTLTKGTYLSFENARLFPLAKAPKLDLSEGLLPEGMYKVGVDLPPGSYRAVPDGSGYLEVSRDSHHALASIVSNDVLASERTITLRPGQYLKLVSVHLLLK
jgi:hypothetical protein